ncbi:ABC transporter ATP-binding protein [Actinomadura luteofluorescens]
MASKERLEFRREKVGFIWQQTSRNLLPYLTAAQNVELPMRFAGRSRRARATRAAELLGMLDVGDCADRRPAELSGGQQQRIAIAVAVANEPQVVLADEPTGELDTATAAGVFAALRRVNQELGTTTVVVTHDAQVSERVDRTVGIRDGRTSVEVRRRSEEDGTRVVEEYALLDRVGRVQLPKGFTQSLDMRDRVRLALESDHVGVWPDREETR